MVVPLNRQSLLAVGVLVFVLMVTPLTAYLLSQNQNPQSKASSGSGTATVTIGPATTNLNVGQTQKVNLYFNTMGQAVGIVSMRVTYPFSGSSPQVVASNLAIDQNFLVNANGDWTCSVHSIDDSSPPNVNVDISCVNTNLVGFTSNADTLIATFDLTANSAPSQNPLVLSFDAANSHIRLKSDNSDVLLTPSSYLSLTVNGSGQTPTPTPTPTATPTPTSSQTHNACFNNTCAVFSGPGTNDCSTVGAQCTQQYSQQAVSGCNGKFDPNCYDCANDGVINILDFACFRAAFGQHKQTGINWQ